jgi:hypothetical protein
MSSPFAFPVMHPAIACIDSIQHHQHVNLHADCPGIRNILRSDFALYDVILLLLLMKKAYQMHRREKKNLTLRPTIL